MESLLNVDVLNGLNNYYKFIDAMVIRRKSDEPMASMTLESTLGWTTSCLHSMDNETNVYIVDNHWVTRMK